MAQRHGWFYIRRANERASSCSSCEKTIVLPYCDPVEPCEKKDWHTQCGIKWTPSVPCLYSTWDGGIIIWKAAAYSTENLLPDDSKENLELYFLSVVNRPKWVGKSIHKNQQKKNASFFKQNVVTTYVFLGTYMSFHRIIATQ